MMVPRISVVSRRGIRDSGAGVSASWKPGLGLFTEIRAHQPLSIPFPVFESGEIVVDRIVRIGVEMIIRDRNLRV